MGKRDGKSPSDHSMKKGELIQVITSVAESTTAIQNNALRVSSEYLPKIFSWEQIHKKWAT
jgi:hypothetical protein